MKCEPSIGNVFQAKTLSICHSLRMHREMNTFICQFNTYTK